MIWLSRADSLYLVTISIF